MTVYREALTSLLAACAEYRNRAIGLDELQGAVWQAALTVVAADEQALRAFLQQAEGRLDMVQFTTDERDTFTEALKIVALVEARARQALDDVAAGATHLSEAGDAAGAAPGQGDATGKGKQMWSETLDALLADYRALLDILQREGPAGDVGDASLDYLVRTTQSAITLLEDARTSQNTIPSELRDELVEIYARLTRPRIGLYDYFLWRDDVSERKQVNAALDTIKDDLKRIYATL